jgi:zinc transport system ATP-binding protein
MNDPVLLGGRQLSYRVRDRAVLSNVDIELRRGEIVTLNGPNGAGKTSLVRILLGLVQPSGGELIRSPGLRIGYVPQELSISRVLPLRVRDFLELAGRYRDAEFNEVLAEVNSDHLLMSPIQSISGGELQRVLLARALLRKPQVLVLDEPAQGVDLVGQQVLYRLINQIRDRYHCGVLMVSHDLHLVMAATDRVICLSTHVCCTGHPDDVSEHPEYLKIFGSALEGFALYSHHHDHAHDARGNVVPLESVEAGPAEDDGSGDGRHG